MRVPEYLAGIFKNAGVKQIFGIPGGPSIPYMEAFREKGIRFILVSNEASAGIMADVTARLTGIPGICHATFGPGATNISTGIGGALLDRSPVIVLTSEMDDRMLNRTTQMNISHQELFKPLTKATFRLDPENAMRQIEDAMRICIEEYPGPVHLGLPSDLADKDIIPHIPENQTPAKRNIRNNILNIRNLINGSKSPIIAAGLTAKRKGADKELVKLAEKLRIPVVITPMAKGIIPEDHPCYAGVLFHSLSDRLEVLTGSADLVIGFGYDPVEYNYESWMPDVPLIHFNTKECDLPESVISEQYIGEPTEWNEILNDIDHSIFHPALSSVKAVREEMRSAFNKLSDHFGPVSAMKTLRDEIPQGSVITFDVGSHLHLAGQLWDCRKGEQILMTNGWSGMGFGIPAAVAAKICLPDSQVICVTGDGGFLMMAGEIITARRYNLPVKIVVFSDGELNLIRLKQSWKGAESYGTHLYDGDLFGSETFLGVKVFKAESADEFTVSLRSAFSINEPVIINAVIDPDDYRFLVVRK